MYSYMMEVSRLVRSESEVARAREWCLEALKQRLWAEVWSDMIELGGASVSVRRVEGGFLVKAEI